jgi:splicing factor 45
VVEMDWDDIYDPSRPNSYEEYKGSEEKVREVREWKDLLYRHRMRRRRDSSGSNDSDGPSEYCWDEMRHELTGSGRPMATGMGMSFAPPKNYDEPPPPPEVEMTEAAPPPPADVPDDATGEDAYARRLRLSQQSPPPPPTSTDSGQITRAPVRYTQPPPPPPRSPSPEPADEPKSSRPGQAGFAARLMSKYGWSKGQGLGANSDGITTALYAKADKRKKKSDAEGGGFATPATGRIVGGKPSKEEEGKFGKMSEVLRLEGMLEGLHQDEDDGMLVQEIGEECDRYGKVERVKIDWEGRWVFVVFVSAVSALNAVGNLEGRVFGGNVVRARFWGREEFERGKYE